MHKHGQAGHACSRDKQGMHCNRIYMKNQTQGKLSEQSVRFRVRQEFAEPMLTFLLALICDHFLLLLYTQIRIAEIAQPATAEAALIYRSRMCRTFAFA